MFLLVTTFLFSMGLSLVFPVLPFVVLQYVPNPAQQPLVIGALGAAFALLSFLSAPVLGALSDVWGRRPVLILSLLGSAVGYVIFGIGGSVWMLLLGRSIDGLTAGGMSALFGYVADTTPPEERGAIFGKIGATVGAGFILGPALGGALAHFGLSAPMYAAAAVCALNAAWGHLALPESVSAERRKAATFDATHLNPLTQLRGALALPVVRRLVTVSILFTLPFTVMQATSALLFQRTLGWGPAQVSTVFMTVGVCDILAQGVLLPHLIRALGDQGVARLGLSLGVLGLAGLATLPILPLAGLLYPSVILFAVGEGIFTATQGALLSVAAPGDTQGRVQGGAQAMTSLAQTAGPLLGGTLYSRVGGGPTYAAGAALVLVALGVLTTSPLPTPQEPEPLAL